ncbi:MAG TPA: DUF2917 domain-containing protein [Caldimonas sp.]|jgi:hypothetical protein
MDIRIDESCFDLRAHQIVRFDDATGAAIVCLRGELWLTQDGSPDDVILGPGERFALDRPGLALVEALKASSLRVAMPLELHPGQESWRRRAGTAGSGRGTPVLLAPGFAILTR